MSFVVEPWITTWLFAASHIYLEKYITIKSTVFPQNQALGGFVRLNTLNFWGRFVLICRWTLNWYMALCCFSYLLAKLHSYHWSTPRFSHKIRLNKLKFWGRFVFVVFFLISSWLIAASDIFLEKISNIKLRGFYTKSSAEWGDLYV